MNGEIDADPFASLHAQLFELWIEPELARRGDLVRDKVRRALVLMTAGRPTVLLDDEFNVIAIVRSTRAIAPDEFITTNDYSNVPWMQPAALPLNVGWILYVVLGTDPYITFDLRSNRQQCSMMAARAVEFLTTAEEAFASGRLAPAVDTALSAAELVVKAQIYLFGTPNREGHAQRLTFWAEWVRLGNAPQYLANTFRRLTHERGSARYADGPLSMDADAISLALTEVRDMTEYIRDQIRLPSGRQWMPCEASRALDATGASSEEELVEALGARSSTVYRDSNRPPL